MLAGMAWPDVRDWIAASATTFAAVFAAVAIWQGKKSAERSATALIRERRIDFELGILKELAQVLDRGDAYAGGKIAPSRTLINLLDDDIVPMYRHAVDLETTPDARRRVEAASGALGTAREFNPRLTASDEAIREEVKSAIRNLLTERDSQRSR